MKEENKEAWRLTYFAHLLEASSGRSEFDFMAQYVIRWHEVDDIRRRERMYQRRTPDGCWVLPLLICLGNHWLVTGYAPGREPPYKARRVTFRASSIPHAICIWLQWVRDYHRLRYEHGELLPRESLGSLVEQLPPLDQVAVIEAGRRAWV
jgi:hypothetical protein